VRTRSWRSRALALLATALANAANAAGAPDPGDYIPAPPNATVAALYAQRLEADKVYADNKRVAGNLGLRLDVGVARFMHYFEWMGKPADVELILPFGRQRISSASDNESGVGNLTLGTTLWTMADEAAGNYLGWAAYLSLPTGQKRAEQFFASEDRYALDLEGGYITRLADKVSLDLIGQAEFYTRDRTSDTSRRPLVRAFAHLSYHLSDTTRLAFSVRQSHGTRERLNGLTVIGPRNDTNLMLTWAQQVTEAMQLQLQYAQDVKVRNGAAVKGFQARAAFVF
jgi:hypothetical protein